MKKDIQDFIAKRETERKECKDNTNKANSTNNDKLANDPQKQQNQTMSKNKPQKNR